MPRKAPDNVQEMRVTLGNYERQTLTEFNKTLTSVRRTAQIPQYVLGGGVLVIGGALGFAAYTAYKYLNLPEFFEDTKDKAVSTFLDVTKYGIFGDNVNNPLLPQRTRDVLNAGYGKFDSYEEIHAAYDGRIDDFEKKLAYMRKTNATAGFNIYPISIINKIEEEVRKQQQFKSIALRAYTQYLLDNDRMDEIRPREGT